MVCTPGLLLAFDKAPTTISKDQAIKNAETAALAYGIGGIFSLLGYFYIAYTALTHYGLDSEALLNDVWFEANPAVKFMTIDCVVFWLAGLLFIGTRSLRRMVEALLTTPFFGPGAACGIALASLEMDASPVWTQDEAGKKTS